MSQNPHSPGYRWARDNFVKSPEGVAAWGFQERLEQSQWFTAEQHRIYQMKRAEALLRHVAEHVPHYHRLLDTIGLKPDEALSQAHWCKIPLLNRRDLQEHRFALTSTFLPPDHGTVREVESSGSTGIPVVALSSELTGGWNRALLARGQLWAMRRFDRRMAVIRRYGNDVARFPEGITEPSWVETLSLPVKTGPLYVLNSNTPIAQQAEWLNRVRPDVLFIYPSVLAALLEFAKSGKLKLPELKRILTISEAVDDDLRADAKRLLKVDIFDTYSANEIGTIALQCPDARAYHIQSEAVMVEVLDEAGEPCKPGETGRVVLTLLHNYAMPLIRYEIGDLATVGRACSCGRGLPVITRIVGRQRNLMVGPNGERFRPSFGWKHIKRMGPSIDQIQFVQTAVDRLEGRVVAKREISESEAEQIRAHLKGRVPDIAEVTFVYFDEIPRPASGKFEDFMSMVPPAGSTS